MRRTQGPLIFVQFPKKCHVEDLLQRFLGEQANRWQVAQNSNRGVVRFLRQEGIHQFDSLLLKFFDPQRQVPSLQRPQPQFIDLSWLSWLGWYCFVQSRTFETLFYPWVSLPHTITACFAFSVFAWHRGSRWFERDSCWGCSLTFERPEQPAWKSPQSVSLTFLAHAQASGQAFGTNVWFNGLFYLL